MFYVLCLLLINAFPLHASILPPNSMQIPPSVKNTGITEEQYHDVIDKFEKVYTPIVAEYGAELKFDRLWKSSVVNAGTLRDEGGKHWHVKLYGGLPRHVSMTVDGFALVICHELGHHLGGAPKKTKNVSPGFWGSTEGQSDYFATLKCLRRFFHEDKNTRIVSKFKTPDIIKESCSEAFKSKNDYAICVRSSLAGQAVALMNADIQNRDEPSLETPSDEVTDRTIDHHPPAQCRLDTYFQGAICPVDFSVSVSDRNEFRGTCSEKKGFLFGNRPACWYREK